MKNLYAPPKSYVDDIALSDSRRDSKQVSQRPMGVWVVAVVATLVIGFIDILILLSWLTDDLPAVDVRLFLYTASHFWWATMAITQTITIGGAASLFMLRRSTQIWWISSMGVTALTTCYNLLVSEAGLAALQDGNWLLKAFGSAAPLVIYAYAKRLRIEGVLR